MILFIGLYILTTIISYILTKDLKRTFINHIVNLFSPHVVVFIYVYESIKGAKQ